MNIRPLSFHGAWEITPQQHGDPRGLFLEWYRFDRLEAEVGHPMRLAQANLSVSSKDVVRGIHFADVPLGQSKYVTCVRGAVLDVVADLRVGSPTFGQWEGVRLDDTDRKALYIAEGMGHGFCALSDDATLSYLVSDVFRPEKEHSVHPLDPDLGIQWQAGTPQLSARDAAAPSLADMLAAGSLPDFDVCQARYKELAAGA
ncbi:dTDP-4-dehydrorhamnose 3,5-epimerase [Streptomyces sp. H10-C2]|uniref:dTDP-4-dehydrorhamnose 3,5-epimerase family protein n=1 Tax=unclassified Streptomyces TaxID=2593676 RepID=UPI0024B90E7B|nr:MULTISPECIES: dTDP-4-dehydrorhamnose 3,5-epimerase [unclassified Streptomyces]MDJ0342467.1 dTDP-4-dehydrorhamnose 3,5-epimerase [Streptomyces sp. PH10-H1]MDJ0372322.1 dTDP-4-dehydrorhamnose 3,5-epimerase [Streptomyces sp. H10-C2]